MLEAIFGVLFPTKSDLCTRFPIELVLRKTSHINISVSIVPYESCSKSEQLTLGSFHKELNNFNRLPSLIKNAKSVMVISAKNDYTN